MRFRLGWTCAAAVLYICVGAACQPATRDTGRTCNAGETVSRPCGECGEEIATCVDGVVGDFSSCEQPAICRCNAGDQLTHACGTCGTATSFCENGAFTPFGPCAEPPSCGCTDGQTQQRSCGTCGTETATCFEGTWSPFGTCVEAPSCECQDGESGTRPCGNCGSQSRSCADGHWADWSSCGSEGECAVGAVESEACGSDVGACVAGAHTRSCAATCTWSAFGECAGAGQVEPVAEVCGDSADNNCNGFTDEGCSCSPVGAGAGGSFAVAGDIRKLAASPGACTLYALAAGTPSQVVVIDTTAKAEIGRIDLPFAADDMDLSPDGSHLVVSHDAIHKVSVIDTALLAVGSTISTLSDPYRVEVSNDGRVWYVELDQWVDIHHMDLATGTGSDTLAGSWSLYAGDLELSSDGQFLYGGEAGISGGELYKWNVGGGMLTQVDRSTWDDGYGFPYPTRHLYLAPGGQDVYYAGYQLDAGQLAFTRGKTGERIFVSDRAASFAVGEGHVLDAKLLRAIATLSPAPTAAALAAEDRELWTYAASSGRMYYRNVDDFVLGADLGTRERTPQALASYGLTRLVHDPVRARLYGLSPSRQAVVAIDATTLAPISEIVVGSTPTDLAVDATGQYLWVGHLDTLALARIDLATLAFDRFVVMPRDTYEVEALAGGRVATVDEDQWTTVSIVDGQTGTVLAQGAFDFQPALSATADGNTLFVGESSLSGSNIKRFDVSGGVMTQVDISDYDSGYGFPYPARQARALPDGSGVYYAGYLLDGHDLSILQYPMADPILNVTPDGTRAISATKVYATANGALRGTLPTSGSVQAVSPDGHTLFVVAGSGIVRVDLSGF